MERSQAERLAPVRVVLLDLDGVLYVEEALVPGARDAVERLRSRGLELRFVTSTTSHSHPVFLPSAGSSSAIRRRCSAASDRSWPAAKRFGPV